MAVSNEWEGLRYDQRRRAIANQSSARWIAKILGVPFSEGRLQVTDLYAGGLFNAQSHNLDDLNYGTPRNPRRVKKFAGPKFNQLSHQFSQGIGRVVLSEELDGFMSGMSEKIEELNQDASRVVRDLAGAEIPDIRVRWAVPSVRYIGGADLAVKLGEDPKLWNATLEERLEGMTEQSGLLPYAADEIAVQATSGNPITVRNRNSKRSVTDDRSQHVTSIRLRLPPDLRLLEESRGVNGSFGVPEHNVPQYPSVHLGVMHYNNSEELKQVLGPLNKPVTEELQLGRLAVISFQSQLQPQPYELAS